MRMDLETYLQKHTQHGLAKRLGVTQSSISQWLSGATKITAERAIEIELATNCLVTREELRPDIFRQKKKARA